MPLPPSGNLSATNNNLPSRASSTFTFKPSSILSRISKPVSAAVRDTRAMTETLLKDMRSAVATKFPRIFKVDSHQSSKEFVDLGNKMHHVIATLDKAIMELSELKENLSNGTHDKSQISKYHNNINRLSSAKDTVHRMDFITDLLECCKTGTDKEEAMGYLFNLAEVIPEGENKNEFSKIMASLFPPPEQPNPTLPSMSKENSPPSEPVQQSTLRPHGAAVNFPMPSTQQSSGYNLNTLHPIPEESENNSDSGSGSGSGSDTKDHKSQKQEKAQNPADPSEPVPQSAQKKSHEIPIKINIPVGQPRDNQGSYPIKGEGEVKVKDELDFNSETRKPESQKSQLLQNVDFFDDAPGTKYAGDTNNVIDQGIEEKEDNIKALSVIVSGKSFLTGLPLKPPSTSQNPTTTQPTDAKPAPPPTPPTMRAPRPPE